MGTVLFSQHVRVACVASAMGVTWSVLVEGDRQFTSSGDGAKGRALAAALQLTEELRMLGPVLLVVESGGASDNVTRIVRTQLAS